MNSVLMQPWPTRLINIRLSVNMIGPFILEFSLRATLSWFMTKIRTPWGKESLNPCGSDPSLLRRFEGNALVEPRNGLYLKKYYS
jgi:hypothetical protein